ncbi:hypothetical protein RA27_00655 [Ruegeria sp. ANG-R]|uniref:cytochrome c n=1 Tax=Ruegeria sp. ANG-R TaxID=1577903 RepID=UPI00057EE77A|nr:cytochrome c [Ruegeria sp. ANG-R]KIC41956.1 hypothetical protein RA27_00655 [Ruegeria sp. ANG-R]
MRRFFGRLILLGIFGLIGYVVFAFVWGVPSVPARPLATDEKTIAEGKYLAVVGDCTSCHTAEDGASFAGGRLLETPFGGGIYSSNITPSEDGIRGMTSAEFYQIMAYGADSVMRPLYPAMPYPSFHIVTRDDSDSIFAYLMSLDPVDAKVPANTLPFPFNIRQSLFGWNFLFAGRGAFEPDSSKGAVWNRGAYLVEGLGHCGGCHTPRNLLGGAEEDKALSGAKLTGFEAPDITPDGLVRRGWTQDHLLTYFRTGDSPQGTAFGEMHLVVKNSLSHMTSADQLAVATYLLNGEEPKADTKPQISAATLAAEANYTADHTAGQALYLANCSLCHGRQGQGIPNTMPPLDGNGTVAQRDGVNLALVIAHGLSQEESSRIAAFGPMPAFSDRLSVIQMTDLMNYLRKTFADHGEQPSELTAKEIRQALGTR